MRLTKANYFSSDNKYISHSKICDWEKDKHYFYRKHVKSDLSRPVTRLMVLGQAVDTWLTKSEADFKKKYVAVSRRNLKNPPKTYVELTISEFDLVVRTCQGVESQDAFKELADFTSQKILKADLDDMKQFPGICGIPDWYKVKGTHAIVVDLKTTESIAKKKYFWHCKTYNYFRQQAMYQVLLKFTFPKIETFESWHLAVERNNEGLFRCQTFILDQDEIVNQKEVIMNVIYEIDAEKKFLPRNVNWNDAIPIRGEDF